MCNVGGTIVSERPFSQALLPSIVAHRGAPTELPENTLAAFEAALDARAAAVEFDVRVTADGQAVVIHDAALDRTTDGSGLVRDHTLAEVLRARIAGPGGRAYTVPTLHETLAMLSGRAAVDIEIKNVPGDRDFDPDQEVAVGLVHRALDDVGFTGDVIVSSFNPRSIAESRELRPEVATGLLTDPSVDAAAALHFAGEQGHAWILPFVDRVDEQGAGFAEVVHAAGLLLGTWIVDDADRARELLIAGVDAVATNEPRAIVAACRDLLPS
jgi:glycerophosphoryl diester phosphodiesterase